MYVEISNNGINIKNIDTDQIKNVLKVIDNFPFNRAFELNINTDAVLEFKDKLNTEIKGK